MRRTPVFALALALASACAGDDPKESDSAAASTLPQLTITASATAGTDSDAGATGDSASAGTEGGSDSDDSAGTGSGGSSSAGVKFDLGIVPDGGALPDDTGCENVDLLFVIDNSGSMADEQQNLISSFPGFAAAMQSQLESAESYHVGVVTSDANIYNSLGCTMAGALVTKTGGLDSSNQTCAPYASGKSYMNEEDDLGQKFQCAAKVGTGGSGNEQPMFTMGQAISAGLNGGGACNDGFIREDALLVVVIITDEEDDHEVEACNQLPQSGSPGEPGDWYQTLVSAKQGVETNVVVLSLIGPPAPNTCPALDKCNGGIQGAEVATRVAQFTEMFTYGTIGQVCAPTFDTFFSDAIGVIDSACKNFQPPG
ncbi:MAG: hypothetical protein R3A79_06635 [Nannocystaceae bacterium]